MPRSRRPGLRGMPVFARGTGGAWVADTPAIVGGEGIVGLAVMCPPEYRLAGLSAPGRPCIAVPISSGSGLPSRAAGIGFEHVEQVRQVAFPIAGMVVAERLVDARFLPAFVGERDPASVAGQGLELPGDDGGLLLLAAPLPGLRQATCGYEFPDDPVDDAAVAEVDRVRAAGAAFDR